VDRDGDQRFASLALEVVWFRLMTQYVDATTYAFTSTLAAVLLGIAAGGALASHLLRGERDWHAWVAAVQVGTGLAVLAGMTPARPLSAWRGRRTPRNNEAMNALEAVAVVFGLLAVWLTVRQSIWCYPTGLVQVSLYIVVFFEAKLYSDALLHMIYVPLQVYGWHHWLHGGRDHGRLRVSRLTPPRLAGWTMATLVAAALWGHGMATYTDAAAPYGDAFVVMGSLVAMWLQTNKRVDSWFFWIAINVVGIVIYYSKGLYLTTGLYVVFLVLAIQGWRAWQRACLDLDRGHPEGWPPHDGVPAS
jgi:nicotinamide mononucleotide transporter